jgi:hypothetical protein
VQEQTCSSCATRTTAKKASAPLPFARSSCVLQIKNQFRTQFRIPETPAFACCLVALPSAERAYNNADKRSTSLCEKLLRSQINSLSIVDDRRQSTNCGGFFVGLEVFVLESPRGRRLVSPRGRLVCTREGDSPRSHERLISSQPNGSGCSRPPHLR